MARMYADTDTLYRAVIINPRGHRSIYGPYEKAGTARGVATQMNMSGQVTIEKTRVVWESID